MSLSCVLLHSTVFVGAIGYVILALLCCAAGIVMYGYYLQIGCDPLEAGQLYSPNQVRATFWYMTLHLVGFQLIGWICI